MKQGAIEVPEPTQDSRSLHEILIGVLREFGPRKQDHLAAQLAQATGRDVSKGHLSEVLDGKGKHWPADWIDYIVEHYDFRAEVAQYYARLRGLEVQPARRRTAAEENRRLRFVLGKHNALGKAIQDEADALPDDVFADEEDGASR